MKEDGEQKADDRGQRLEAKKAESSRLKAER
jgi:hypothetical protein